MKMTENIFLCLSLSCSLLFAQAVDPSKRQAPIANHLIPVFRPENMRADEKPVEVKTENAVLAENAFFRIVRTTIAFTNPNGRAMAGELEFPVPSGGAVCGYALEIDGTMVPGVVCEKEKARVAFENEVRKGVDPGIVEHVKGDLWKTRIFPLNPNTPRRASVDTLEPLSGFDPRTRVVEQDGEDIFEATVASAAVAVTVADRIKTFDRGWILWDASMSRDGKVADDLERLAKLPETGDWVLLVFSNVPEKPERFSSRKALIDRVKGVQYDGGTDIVAARASVPVNVPVLLFSDELDTLSEESAVFDGDPSLVCVSRPDAPARAVLVRKLAAGEKPATEPVKGRVLATAWAARRIADLSSQADARKDEFLALGRTYGVASPVTSLIVLETLDQWLEHDIEPPETLALHAEWKKRTAARDDPIRAKEEAAAFEKNLLEAWRERVEWWKNPIPPNRTPKSGLFENEYAPASVSESGSRSMWRSMSASRNAVSDEADGFSAGVMSACEAPGDTDDAAPAMQSASVAQKTKAAPLPQDAGGPAATVRITEWKPDAPYVKALEAASDVKRYEVYLHARKTYGSSPAFYLDASGFFFKAGDRAHALRIISNLAELKLENPALWRTMGWRLREAGVYDEAVRAFRHVVKMRGEEGHSYRDLALVLAERGKEKFSARDLGESMALYRTTAFRNFARRSARRSNDFQVAVFALEELNALIAWCKAREWKDSEPEYPALDEAFRRDLPVKIRIVLSWDADETDIDLHVLETGGEEAYYGHRRTSAGGFVSEDVTTGYGPEEYLRKESPAGTYKILTNYFASRQTALTGPATVTATVYTDWGTAAEKRQVLSLRLDKPKNKCSIGSVDLQ